MSLSSFLLGKRGAGAVDKDLDSLFQSQKPPGPEPNNAPAQPRSERKRKSKDDIEGTDNKRSRAIIDEVRNDDHGDSDAELVHETLREGGSQKKKGSSSTKIKHVPEGETAEQRNARTIFIGNLPVVIAQKRPLLKQLQKHILSHLPSAKIESSRFRSVPFQKPTNTLTTDDETAKSKLQSRQHERDRASTWRNSQSKDDDPQIDEKKFLTPNQKKKVAFINHEFHTSADIINAYMVFAHPIAAESRPSNLPPLPPMMNPYEAARMAVEKCDGTMFMDRMMRVDLASKSAAAEVSSDQLAPLDVDPKLNVFIGNLDFESKEEDLRVFFEGVISAELGPREFDSDTTDSEVKVKSWVTRVRIIRDKDTQLGKGFAYVQFADRECVDEVLAMEEGKLKFAKRKLRVQRCKTVPGSASSKTKGSKTPIAASSAPLESIPMVPQGDPSLGAKLAHLSKDERKKAKSADADRLARRLAKKKARMVLAKQGVKNQVKDRERVRKSGPGKTSAKASGPHKKESKGRVRSDKSIAKRNHKK